MATATELRSLVQTLSDEAGSDLSLLWAQIFTPDLRAERDSLPDVGGSYEVWIRPLLAELQDALMDVMPALVAEYGDAASVVSADWYDEYRDAQGVGGSFRADVPVSQNLGAEALAGWGSSLITPETADWDAALTRLNGGLQRRISDSSRATITGATHADPRARGWQRKARPDGCGFCQMLAGRATLYRSQGTADFGAHDHCHCVAVPAFGGQPLPVRAYTPTSRNITDADRARTRAWIKANL